MKKTLIALAALAATGASFAQVTITGNLTSGFQQKTTNAYTGQGAAITTLNAVTATTNVGAVPVAAGSTLVAGGNRVVTQNVASGLGVDTAEVFLSAKEDIGGGQSVEAKLGLTNVARGGAGTGAFGANDVTLTYTNTSFGRIQYGNTYGGAVFSGLPTAGAPVIDMDEKLFERRSASEYIQYAAPIGPITLVYQHGEASAGTGLGVGQSGTPATVGQRSNMLLGLYRDGPLEAFLAYKTYDNGDGSTIYGVNQLTKDRQWSLQGAYDFGVAKLGFGYAHTTAHVGATVADMLVGLNVPMGALEVGATWGQEIVGGISGVADSALSTASSIPTGTTLAPGVTTTAATAVLANAKALLQRAEGTATGWSVGAKYNLSKRTNFKANYAAWTRSGYAQFEAQTAAGRGVFGNADIETQFNLLLSHSF